MDPRLRASGHHVAGRRAKSCGGHFTCTETMRAREEPPEHEIPQTFFIENDGYRFTVASLDRRSISNSECPLQIMPTHGQDLAD